MLHGTRGKTVTPRLQTESRQWLYHGNCETFSFLRRKICRDLEGYPSPYLRADIIFLFIYFVRCINCWGCIDFKFRNKAFIALDVSIYLISTNQNWTPVIPVRVGVQISVAHFRISNERYAPASRYFRFGAHPASYSMCTRGSFYGDKAAGHEADHSPPSGAEGNAWNYTPTLPWRLHGVVLT
jgi:hypothetical protein